MDGVLLGTVFSRPDDNASSGRIWRVADQSGGRMNMDNEVSAGLAPFCMRVADLVMRIRPLHAMVGRLCKDYVVDAPLAVDIEIGATQTDIDYERDMATEGTDWTDAYLETLAVQRAIANRLPEQHRLLAHGAVIEFEGRAYLFTAPSGTGKSTHIRLWRQYLGNAVRVINGDKPFVRIPSVAKSCQWSMARRGPAKRAGSAMTRLRSPVSCCCPAASRAHLPFARRARRSVSIR